MSQQDFGIGSPSALDSVMDQNMVLGTEAGLLTPQLTLAIPLFPGRKMTPNMHRRPESCLRMVDLFLQRHPKVLEFYSPFDDDEPKVVNGDGKSWFYIESAFVAFSTTSQTAARHACFIILGHIVTYFAFLP
jgi:hypothetical protein